MRGTPNNGVRIGDVYLVMTSVDRTDSGPFATLANAALSLAFLDDVAQRDYILTVQSASGDVRASRRFRTKTEAERARTALAADADAAPDLSSFDWETGLGGA